MPELPDREAVIGALLIAVAYAAIHADSESGPNAGQDFLRQVDEIARWWLENENSILSPQQQVSVQAALVFLPLIVERLIDEVELPDLLDEFWGSNGLG